MENRDIARIFNQIADVLEITGGIQYKIRAYRRAAMNIEGLSKRIEDIYREDERGLREIPGVGEGIAKKIKEIIKTGRLKKHQELLKKVPPELLELTQITGVGLKHLKALMDGLNVKNVDDLERVCKEHKVRELEGFGQITEEKILIALKEYRGSKGRIKLSKGEEKRVLIEGSQWAIKQGYGWSEDADYTEDRGRLDGADPSAVSSRAIERGREQLGTLGAGNHFLEIQVVSEIYNPEIAEKLGIFRGQICVMIHCGSRGLGHQVCDDYIEKMGRAITKYKIDLPDRQLACAPLNSPEGEQYFSAMKAAANYAYANRQCIMHWVRGSFEKVFGRSAENLGMRLVYDVTHNTAKVEEHTVDGKKVKVCVHRKGATRSFPAHHPVLPEEYYDIGQPVIIPGDMGRSSFLLVGKKRAMEDSFGSTCHGAGRLMSRRKAIKSMKGRAIDRELEDKGIYVKSRGRDTLKEECPEAYKDVEDVVDVVHRAGLSEKIAKLVPIGVIKG